MANHVFAMCLLVSLILVPFAHSKIPVIIDTDLGTDMDDSWAIVFLLHSPEVDVKLIVTETHNTPARTKILAKMLQYMNRTDVPIGMGPEQDNSTGPVAGALYGWAADYDLSTYPGVIYTDGVGAIYNTIMLAADPYTIILEIAPCPNIQALLQQYPEVSSRVRIVAMGGSIHIGYSNTSKISPEYNIADDVPAAEAMYSAKWPIVTAPLDVTIYSQMTGGAYSLVRNAAMQNESLGAQVLMQQFQYWFQNCAWEAASGLLPTNPFNVSSTLHDLVAATIIFKVADVKIEPLPIVINATGFTLVDPRYGRPVEVAVSWQNISDWFWFTASRVATADTNK